MPNAVFVLVVISSSSLFLYSSFLKKLKLSCSLNLFYYCNGGKHVLLACALLTDVFCLENRSGSVSVMYSLRQFFFLVWQGDFIVNIECLPQEARILFCL